MLAVSGVTLIKFFTDEFYLLVLGITLIPVSFAISVFGFIRYRTMCKRITKTYGQEKDTENNSNNK
jgi:hypothetical protein